MLRETPAKIMELSMNFSKTQIFLYRHIEMKSPFFHWGLRNLLNYRITLPNFEFNTFLAPVLQP